MRAVLAVLVVFAALPSTAQAVTVRVSAPPGSANRALQVTLQGATTLTVGRSGNDVFLAARSGDTFTQTGTAGCTSVDGGLLCGTEASIGRITVTGSTGSDVLTISPSITRPATVNGLGGDDVIAGGGGPDILDGGFGDDTITGGAGDDVLRGADGADVLAGDGGDDVLDGGSGADVLAGGGQAGDVLDYSGRTAGVVVDLGRAGGQGEPGENDEVDGFAVVRGGSGPDRLTGADAAERLEGNGGDDVLAGGDSGDVLDGGAGDDSLTGGPGVDRLTGGDGDDRLDARDGVAEASIACGPGADRLSSDATDATPTDCEVVAPRLGGAVAVTGAPAIGAVLGTRFEGQLGGTPSVTSWRWLRCGATGCAPVAAGETYAVTAADAGAQLVAVLRAENEAGAEELATAPTGVVSVPAPVATPAPSPGPTVTTRVRSIRCQGRRCRVSVSVSGAPASVRVELSRGGRRIAWVTRKGPDGRFTVHVKARRKLTRGTYRIRVTAPGARTSTRAVRVRR